MKKILIYLIVVLCISLSIKLITNFNSSNDEISSNDIDVLKNAIVISSLSMEDDVENMEGKILYDDNFVISERNTDSENENNTNNKTTTRDKTAKEKIKSTDDALTSTGSKYFSSLKKKDIRWHIVEHRIRKNENLLNIAKFYNTNLSHIARYNNIKNYSLIKLNKLIGIPTREGFYYVVKSGDNLTQIAKAYNLTITKIKEVNYLKKNTLYVGQKIFIRNLVVT